MKNPKLSHKNKIIFYLSLIILIKCKHITNINNKMKSYHDKYTKLNNTSKKLGFLYIEKKRLGTETHPRPYLGFEEKISPVLAL